MRMSTVKKLPGLWLCLLSFLVSQLLAACSGNSNTPGNGVVDLTLWMSPAATESAAPPANWELYKIVHDKLHINLKVTFLPSGTEGVSKMSAAAAANDLPDLFQVPSSDLLQQWISLGLVAPVDDLLPQMPGRTKERYSDAELNKLFTINGKMYVLQETAQFTKTQGVFIRKDWLDRLGLKMPTTLDELLDVAKAFTFKDPDGNGKNDTYGYGANIEVGLGGQGVTMGLGSRFSFIYGAYGLSDTWNYSDPHKISLSLRDPRYREATAFIQKMVQAKVIDPDWTTMKKDDFRARWKQGRYGIMTEQFCAFGCEANYKPFDQNFPEGNFVLLNPLKTAASSTSYLGTYTQAGLQLAMSQKAASAGKGPAIARFLEWLNAGEGYYLAGFGKDGVNYKKDAQGRITTEGVPAPFTTTGRPFVQMRALAQKNDPQEFKIRYPAFKTKNGRTIDPLKLYSEIAAMPWIDITSSLVIKPSPNQSDINRYINENLVQFATGQKSTDPDTWNTFIKGLEGLGVSDWESAANQTLRERGLLK